VRALACGITLAALVTAPALACGPSVNGRPAIPPLAADIDSQLPQAKLPQADREKVAALRERIRELTATGNEADARKAEEEAMRILGYRKIWLRCGRGTFQWVTFHPRAQS
jgi:hypothetical protein